jgi:hypothetical protein
MAGGYVLQFRVLLFLPIGQSFYPEPHLNMNRAAHTLAVFATVACLTLMERPALAQHSSSLTVTTTTLSFSPASPTFSTSVILTATVIPGSPTGTVTFYDGTTVLGDAGILSNTATFTTKALLPGVHSFSAYYGGSTTDKPSGSAQVKATITGAAGGGFNSAPTLIPQTTPVDVESADLNGDGKLDLVVVNQGTNTVSVFLGNEDGTFQGAANYTVGATPNAAVITDVNGDGFPDIIVANQGTDTLSVLLGTGSGTFLAAQSVITLSGPHSLAVADINGDGRPDIVVTSTNHNMVDVALNNGTSTFFDAPTAYTPPGTTKGLVIGDFNGDGFADVAVANYTSSANYVSVFLGNGDGTLQLAVNYTTGVSPVDVATADFNGDGFLDLAVANKGDNTVSVLLGTGTGTFNAAVAYPAGTGPTSVMAVALSGTSQPALVVADNAGNDISILAGNSNGTFQTATTVSVGSGPRSLLAANLNGDEFVDLAVVNQNDTVTPVSILLGVPSTTTTLTVAPNPASPGQTVTLAATVSPSTATGSISFYDGSTLLATEQAVNGVANYMSSTFADGSHTLTAVYAGSDGGSTSPAVILLVHQLSTTTLTITPTASTLGQPVTLTATMTPNTVTGDVEFLDYGGTLIGSAVVSGGQAVLTTSLLSAGMHSVTAHYSGDSGDQTSVSAAVTATVTPAQAGGYGVAGVSYTTGTDPDAVIEGDFNGDGIADLAVANYGSATISIFLGAGSGTFQPPVSYAVGVNPVAIAIGDFNNDGIADLLVSNNGSANLSVLLGNANGTFQAGVFVPVGDLPLGIAVADFNGDGYQDIAVVESGANEIGIVPGNGNGTFQNVQNTLISAGGLRAITVGDFNGDSKPDIAFTGASGAYVLLGNGAYSFSGNPVNYATGGGPFAITTGNFVSSTLDLVVVNSQSNTVSVLLANGANGSFQAAANYPVGIFPQSAVTGDFNGDGFLDIAVVNESSNNVSILYGTGTGAFQPAVNYAAGASPVAIVAGSFNSTGQTDLAVLSYTGSANTNQLGIYLALLGSSVSLNVSPNPDPAGVPVTMTATVTPSAATGTVTFLDGLNTVGSAPLTSGVGTLVATLPAGVQSLTAVYSGDTVYGQSTSAPVTDTVAQAATTVSLAAMPSPATLTQVVTLTATVSNVNATGLVTFYNGTTVIDTALVTGGVAQLLTSALPAGTLNLIARYDGDVNDAAAVSPAVPVTVTAAHGFGFGPPTAFATGVGPVSVTSADFNMDGRIDLAVANATSGTVSVLLGNGDGTFSPFVTLTAGTTPSQVLSTDFNGDGKPDLVVSNSGSNNATVFLGNGDGSFQSGVPYAVGTLPSSIALADFNNDGKVDVMAANNSGGTISFVYGDGDGTLGTTATISVGVANAFVAAGDFNNDGYADVAVADTATNVVWILLGKGNGQFQAPVSFTAGTTPESIATGDFNGDGKLDLAVANSASANVTVLLGNGDGTFQNEVPYPTGAGTQYVAVGDFNGDGILDLAATGQSGNVAILIGNGNGTFQTAASFSAGSTGSEPVSLTVNNFNGDGTDQIAVASKAVNTVSVLLDSPATLTAIAGNNQSAFAGSTFASPLEVEATGFGAPIAGVTVTFSVPSTGPSAEFAGTGLTATAVTGSNGIATSPILSANSTVGNYTVTASVGAASIPFSLSNLTSNCTLKVTGGPLAFDSTGGSGTLTVTASSSSCTWGASTDSSSWITLSTSSGSGNGSVLVTIAANSTGAARSGNVFVAGQTFPVNEALTQQVFADVPPSAYYFDSANLLYAKGITSGCSTSPLDYCPSSNVTRAQMAVFIVASIYGTGDSFSYSPTPYFTDVQPNDFAFAWIQKLYELGITSGCGGGNYCPNADITRAQMAVFIIAARFGAGLPFSYPSAPYFTDVPVGAFAFNYIQVMKEDLITAGCGVNLYCPNNPVDRGDMSLFIMHGLFNALLPAGTPVITSVSPDTLAPNQETTMTITGTSTNFQQGLSIVNPIPGVTFGTPTVTSATSLTVSVTVNPTGSIAQPWPIVVITGPETAVLPNSFTIQ